MDRTSKNRLMMSVCLSLVTVALTGVLFNRLSAEDKKEPPVVKVVAPFGIVRGTTTTVVVRGLRLSEVTELRFPDLKTAPVFKIKTKGAAGADKVPVSMGGNTQIEVELTLATDARLGATPVIAIGPNGASEARQVLILDPEKTVPEKEPNDGFAQAQEITLGQTITGALATNQKTDVFRFMGTAGQKIKITALATKFGSPLDPFLMLHNADGQLLAEIDDHLELADPVLEFTLKKDGPYFLTIMDAHDLSSPVHAYVLLTQVP